MKNLLPHSAALLLMLASAGCVTVIEEPAAQAVLYSTRSGDTVTLSWKTKPGETYAVHWSDSRQSGSKWNVLPGCERIAGNGLVFEHTDRVSAVQPRYYRLIVVPAKK